MDQYHHAQLELNRIKFVYQRDGANAVVEFCEDLIKRYRSCVVKRSAPCGDKEFRIKYIIAIGVAKRVLEVLNV